MKNVHRDHGKTNGVTLPDKEVFSTGELAALCHVTKHTIISAIDRGELSASQTPGGHNCIRRDDAVEFMRRYRYLPEDAPKQKILIVDDKPFVRDILAEVFDGDGVAIYYASGGYEAGKLAERERPDLILLDILLPDIDGREVCRHIRDELNETACRILAVTSLREPEEIEAIYAAGIDDYIAKPFNIEVLREKVEALLNVRA